jgi:hypothetical protein
MSGRNPINSALLVKSRPLLILRAFTSDVALDSDAARIAKLVQEKHQEGSLAAYIKHALVGQMLRDEQSLAYRTSGLHTGSVLLAPYQAPVAQPMIARQVTPHQSSRLALVSEQSIAVAQQTPESIAQGAVGPAPSAAVSHLDIIDQTVKMYETHFAASSALIEGEREARPRRRPGGGALSAMG